MCRFFLLLVSLCLFNSAFSQKVSNTLTGYFIPKDSLNLIESLKFLGNGKVEIGPTYEEREFVQYGDTVIVIPDKSVFKFYFKRDSLIGYSYWAKGVWQLEKDTLVPSKANDLSEKKAPLLLRYYQTFKAESDSDQFSILSLMEEDSISTQSKKKLLDSLCNEGLGVACLDRIGFKIMENTDLMKASLNGTSITVSPDNSIIGLAEKAHQLGEKDAYAVLGAYYIMIGQQKVGKEYLEKASQEGSMKAAMSLFDLSLSEESKPAIKKKANHTKGKTKKK